MSFSATPEISPSSATPYPRRQTPRPPERGSHGVIVARLVDQKRLDHALHVIADARDAGLDAPVTIYGDGPRRDALEELAERLRLSDLVTFAGHIRDAASAFDTAAWTLLTSTFEGAPLTLIEAMSRGCLPIAYDIPYGPRDLITPGLTGYLIPDGDIRAAAQTLMRMTGLPSHESEQMRDAARTRASLFSDRAILTRWAQELPAVPTRPPLTRVLCRTPLRITERADGVIVQTYLARDGLTDAGLLHLENPTTQAVLRCPAKIRGRLLTAHLNHAQVALLTPMKDSDTYALVEALPRRTIPTFLTRLRTRLPMRLTDSRT